MGRVCVHSAGHAGIPWHTGNHEYGQPVRIFAFDVQRLRLYNRLTLSVKEEMRRTEEFWDLYNNRQLDSTVNTREPPTIPQLSLALLCCKPISGTAQRCMYDILGCDSLSSPDLLTGSCRRQPDPSPRGSKLGFKLAKPDPDSMLG